jgi:hypothetical protein
MPVIHFLIKKHTRQGTHDLILFFLTQKQ